MEPLSSTWVCQFQGDLIAALTLAEKALRHLNNSDGSFRDLFVTLPSGKSVKGYISGDKNEKQQATERFSKKLFAAARKVHPTLKRHLAKSIGTISVGWDRAAQVRPPGL